MVRGGAIASRRGWSRCRVWVACDHGGLLGPTSALIRGPI